MYIFLICNLQNSTYQIYGAVSPSGEKLNVLVPWDSRFEDILITRTRKSSSVQSFKTTSQQENLVHGRKTATISKFGALIFEKYFLRTCCVKIEVDTQTNLNKIRFLPVGKNTGGFGAYCRSFYPLHFIFFFHIFYLNQGSIQFALVKSWSLDTEFYCSSVLVNEQSVTWQKNNMDPF